jgi:hypothetical protein
MSSDFTARLTASEQQFYEGSEATVSNREWQQLCEIMNGYIYSQTLVTACDLKLFTHLSEKPGATREDLERILGLSEHGTRVLMLAACACGLVQRNAETGRYYNSSLSQKVLLEETRQSMIPFVQFNHKVQQRCIAQFTRSLKENRNAGLDELPGDGITLYQRLTSYPELETLFQQGMGAYTRLSPNMLDVSEFAEIQSLLDVGGGDGSNAVRLCRRLPRLQATVLDIPSVVPIARSVVSQAGLSERVRCIALDMFADPWPVGHDAVLLSHVVEIFSPEKIRALYAKAYDTLDTNGKLFVWTIMANDSETAALQAAKSSIYFLCVASGEGMAYPAKQHLELMRDVGFSDIKTYGAPEIDHGALVATK